MKFAWLEKLAEEGKVRPEAVEHIYNDCSFALEKHAELHPAVTGILGALMMGGAMSGLEYMSKQVKNRVIDQRTKARTAMVRDRVLSMFPAKEQEKAEARFIEIIKYAPSLGAVEPIMTKMVKKKLHTGLTDSDIQGLLNVQVKLTPDPLRYTALTADTMKELKATGRKYASADVDPDKVAQEFGTNLAEIHLVFEKEANKKQVMRSILSRSQTPFSDIAKYMGAAAVGSLGIMGARTGLELYNQKVKDADRKKMLDQSYASILRASKNSPIANDPLKAKEAFRTLAHFAPHVAAEPRTAKAYIERMVAADTTSTIDELKNLTQVEKNMGERQYGAMDAVQAGLAASRLEDTVGKSWASIMEPYASDLAASADMRQKEGI